MHIKLNRNVSNFLLVQMITLQHCLTKFQGVIVIFWIILVACNFAICSYSCHIALVCKYFW